MKDDDILPVSTPTATSSIAPLSKKENGGSSAVSADQYSLCFGRGRYKFWALAAILLLAFWSMLTGTVTLRLSATNLNHLSRDTIDSPLPEDLDSLEMDEREKLVKQMWDVYTSENKRIRLGKFWQQAFEAAYGLLIKDGVDDPQAAKDREAAISEIAKMSVLLRIPFEPSPAVHSLSIRRLRRKEASRKLMTSAKTWL